MTDEEHDHKLVLHLAVEEMGSPGLVVNPDVAGKTGCRCYAVDGTEMCFSKGVIGTLSKSQTEAYCPTKQIITEGPLVERIRRFREAASAAKERIKEIPKGERLEPWLSAMGEELRKRGIEL